jgi:hypothetical protein
VTPGLSKPSDARACSKAQNGSGSREDDPMKALSLVLAAIVMSICISANGKSVEDADAAKVANCTFIKDVSAVTPSGYTRTALGAAMETARAEAAKAGATHIVWNKVDSMNVTSVSGKAYRCGK